MTGLRKVFFRRAIPDAEPGSPRPDFNENAANELPRWNTSQIYRSLDAPALKRDCARIDNMIAAFAKRYEGTVEFLSPDDFGNAIFAYEAIEAQRNRIACYAALIESEDMTKTAALAPLNAWIAATEKKLAFFESEIASMPEAKLLRTMTDAVVSQYAPWIARVRAGSEHVLDDAAEQKISVLDRDLQNTQIAYVKFIQDLRFDDGKGGSVNLDTAHAALSDQDAAGQDVTRAQLGAALRLHAPEAARLYNQLVESQLSSAQLRHYPRADHETNLENGLPDESIDMMRQKNRQSYKELSQRFYAWKAEQLGVQQMTRGQSSDAVPGFDLPAGYDFKTAKNAVLRAFGHLSPTLEKLARKFFTSRHVDVPPRDNKEPNPFAMPAGPDDYPYVLVNFRGTLGDVVCGLGHELGHGVHFALSEKTRGFFLSENTTILCETASIFAELLVYDELLRQEKDPARKRALEIERFEGILQNALQQAAYFEFELRVHDLRKVKSQLDAEEISDIWLETQQDFYGPAVKLDAYDRYYWMTVPHVFESPFYVYSYAFAQNIVNGLYQQYHDSDKRGPAARAAFADKYMEFLRGGVTKDIYHALRPFDLDVETQEFWAQSHKMMTDALDRVINPPPAKTRKKTPQGPSNNPPAAGV